MATVAFIGLGNMGAPMASNLIQSGHQVRVFDLVESQRKLLEAQGAFNAVSAQEAAEGADCVISMLQKGEQVTRLFLGNGAEERGLLASIQQGAVVIDSSTIDKPSAMALHDACNKVAVPCLDAPVSGGVAAANAGTLTFMCGGDADAFSKGQAILTAMGQNIFHAGPAGSGQVAKMCNNMLLAIHMIGSCEAIALGQQNGLDATTLSDIMKASSGNNWSLEKYNPCPGVMPNVPASNDYRPGFMVDLMVKDLQLAMANAETMNCSTPLGTLATELFQTKQSEGDGPRDFSSIFEVIAP